MIKVRLKAVLGDREIKLGRSITMKEVSEATGIHSVTLSKIAKNTGYNPTLELIDKLCDYFECELSDLLIRVQEENN